MPGAVADVQLDRHAGRVRSRVHSFRTRQPIDPIRGAMEDEHRTPAEPDDRLDRLGRPQVLTAAQAPGGGDQRECDPAHREAGGRNSRHHRRAQPVVRRVQDQGVDPLVIGGQADGCGAAHRLAEDDDLLRLLGPHQPVQHRQQVPLLAGAVHRLRAAALAAVAQVEEEQVVFAVQEGRVVEHPALVVDETVHHHHGWAMRPDRVLRRYPPAGDRDTVARDDQAAGRATVLCTVPRVRLRRECTVRGLVVVDRLVRPAQRTRRAAGGGSVRWIQEAFRTGPCRRAEVAADRDSDGEASTTDVPTGWRGGRVPSHAADRRGHPPRADPGRTGARPRPDRGATAACLYFATTDA